MKRAAGAAINDTNTSSESQSDGSESVGKQCNVKKQTKNSAKKKKYVQKFLASWLTNVGLRNEVRYHIVNTLTKPLEM